jgi:hypothetical protein
LSSFVPPGRKLVELLVSLGIAGIIYLFYPNLDAVILFISGFVWNWSASIDPGPLFENRRYRFSMLSTVIALQRFVLKPFVGAPELLRRLICLFPAGTFWWIVVIINDSTMPWWFTFLGSLTFEVSQIELRPKLESQGRR